MRNRPNSPAPSGDAVASRREIIAVAAAAAGATAFAGSAQVQPAPQQLRPPRLQPAATIHRAGLSPALSAIGMRLPAREIVFNLYITCCGDN
jgi:hypothetical protein